jgi:hypothetical protein
MEKASSSTLSPVAFNDAPQRPGSANHSVSSSDFRFVLANFSLNKFSARPV